MRAVPISLRCLHAAIASRTVSLLVELDASIELTGSVSEATSGYRVDGRLNNSFKAANLLLEQGVVLRRANEAAGNRRRGDFLVGAGSVAAVKKVAAATGSTSTLPRATSLEEATR